MIFRKKLKRKLRNKRLKEELEVYRKMGVV